MPNEFTNPNPHDADPSDIEPVSSEIKKALVDLIEEKTRGGNRHEYESGSWIGRDLLAANGVGTFNVSFVPVEDRRINNGASEIGKIQKNVIGGGLWDVSRYKFKLSADRTIEIEKELTIHDMAGDMAHIEALERATSIGDYGKALELSIEARDSVAQSILGQKEARERGMGFVNQTEAEALLKELQQAQPRSNNL